MNVRLRGRTCPWNTFAIWNVDILALIGFPMIADGTMMDRSIGGVEVHGQTGGRAIVL